MTGRGYAAAGSGYVHGVTGIVGGEGKAKRGATGDSDGRGGAEGLGGGEKVAKGGVVGGEERGVRKEGRGWGWKIKKGVGFKKMGGWVECPHRRARSPSP